MALTSKSRSAYFELLFGRFRVWRWSWTRLRIAFLSQPPDQHRKNRCDDRFPDDP